MHLDRTVWRAQVKLGLWGVLYGNTLRLLAKRFLLQVARATCHYYLAYHGGTTSMKAHLSSHHPDKCSAKRAEEISRRIAEMIARDLQPISIVEWAGFKHLLSYLEPGYCIPSHTHIATVCCCLYKVPVTQLKCGQSVSSAPRTALATFSWTYRNSFTLPHWIQHSSCLRALLSSG